jgi:hypothetical protein
MFYFVALDEFYLNTMLDKFRKRSERELWAAKVPPFGKKIRERILFFSSAYALSILSLFFLDVSTRRADS